MADREQKRAHDLPASDRAPEPSTVAPADAHSKVMRLQATAGNRAVRRLLASAAGDDDGGRGRAAKQVGAAGGSVPADARSAITASRGGGRPLDDSTRTSLEGAVGGDLSGVRLHSGPVARTLNEQLSSAAFTAGRDIFFHGDIPRMDDPAGRSLLTHEVGHTLEGGSAIRRLYVETDAESSEGSIEADGKTIHYRWDKTLTTDQVEATGHSTTWMMMTYPIYRLKQVKLTGSGGPTPKGKAKEPAKAKDKDAGPASPDPAKSSEPAVPAALSAADRRTLEEVQAKLEEWGKVSANLRDKSAQPIRTRLAKEVKQRLAGGPGRAAKDIDAEVGTIQAAYVEAIRAANEAKKAKEDRERAAETERLDREAAAQLDAKLLESCGGKRALLTRFQTAWTNPEIEKLLKLAPANTLEVLLSSFDHSTLAEMLEGATDKGASLLALRANVKKKDHIATILEPANKLTTAHLKVLLKDTSSETLLDMAPKVKSGAVLVRMRTGAASESQFVVTVAGMLGAGWNVEQAHTAAADDTAFGNDLATQKRNIGLIGYNGTEIELRAVSGMSGDGLGGEAEAIKNALAQIDAGGGNLVDVCHKRVKHENREGHLPGARNVKNYWEWDIKPPDGVPWPARRRLVIDEDVAEVAKRPVYYSWNHYGEHGERPAFVRIR